MTVQISRPDECPPLCNSKSKMSEPLDVAYNNEILKIEYRVRI